MDKTTKINTLSTIILVGFTLAVIYHYIQGFYLHNDDLHGSFLYPASAAFCDLFKILPYIKDFKPYQEVTLWIVYFPLTYIFMLPFAFIKNKILSYLIYISGFVVYLTVMNIKIFHCENLNKLQNLKNIFIITCFSYPVLYNLDKGNFDIFLFILLGFWTYMFKKEKYGLSSVLLALVNAMKPFTLYFLLLYLMKKKYKEFFLSIFLTALLVVGGFMIFPDNFFHQITIFSKSLIAYKNNYTLGSFMGVGFCSSLFIPLKTLMLHFSIIPSDLKSFVNIYDYVSYFITAVTLFFVWREKIFWKQLTLLICNFLLLPYLTYDYKLIFLFIPLWLFVNEEKKSKFDLAYIILFGLLLIPKNIIILLPLIKGSSDNWISFSAIANPIVIILLTVLIIYDQFRKQKEA
jgi:hypothetical protein